MARYLLSILLLTVFALSINGQSATRCGTETHRQLLYQQQPDLIQKRQAMELELSDWIAHHAGTVSHRSVITIPVVVHVVWNTNAENISNAQILSQIEILNQDFRALNVEVPTVPNVFKPLVADVELEFCLASKDPNGNPTTGITRTYTDNSIGIGGTKAIHFTSMGGKDAWDTKRYLNIWVAKFAGGVGGIGSFPGEDPPAEDGIEINYKQFGSISLNPPYHLGRTTTHEIGHYFNLEHPWGPQITSCCENDFVSDTPAACETYLNQCPTHPVTSCSQPDMFMNYMFYTNDACMGMFTPGQKMRMLAALNGPRADLLTSDGCTIVGVNEPRQKMELVVLQNPVREQLLFELKNGGSGGWEATLYSMEGIEVFNKKLAGAGQQTIEVSQIPSGIYFLKMEKEDVRLVRKVVIVR